MASKEIEVLLLSHTEFAKIGATDQRNRLVTYYSGWFVPDYRVNTVDNIRATQRLATHAKAMSCPIGTVLMVVLEEASRALHAQRVAPGSGLLGVEAGPADTIQDEDALVEDVPAQRVPDPAPTQQVQEPAPEAMTDDPSPPTRGRPKSRQDRVK